MATSTLGSGTLVLAGTTSGTTTVTATAVAGTTTLTLPAATDTLVGKATTDTLTNKTLTAPTLTSPNITTALTLTGAAGTAGQALVSGGTGAAPTWSTVSATPGGSTTQVQYNNAGAFAGSANLVFDGTNLGVGTAAPAVPLEVDKASGEALRVAATGTNQTIHSRYIGGSPSIGNFIVGVDSATGGAFSGLGPYGVLWQAGNTGIAFGTNNALAMSLNTSGTLILKGGSSSATGVGITFPATQSASSDANTLDDYEEGSWTPSLGGTSTGTFTGKYVKVGKLVTLYSDISVTLIGTGSTTQITGIPFTATSGGSGSLTPSYTVSLATAIVSITAYVDGSTIYIASRTAAAASGSTNAIFGNGTSFSFLCTYIATA